LFDGIQVIFSIILVLGIVIIICFCVVVPEELSMRITKRSASNIESVPVEDISGHYKPNRNDGAAKRNV